MDDEDAGPGRNLRGRLGRATGRARAADVVREGGNEPGLGGEGSLFAQPFPQLDDEPRAVQVALEVEEIRLDASLRAAVVRVRADRDRRGTAERGAGVHPVRGNEQV